MWIIISSKFEFLQCPETNTWTQRLEKAAKYIDRLEAADALTRLFSRHDSDAVEFGIRKLPPNMVV